jgi:hypothetical protein
MRTLLRRPESQGNYAKFTSFALVIFNRASVEQNWHPTCKTSVGEGTPKPIGRQTMLDTALLIASALSLALMVAFSKLP